MPAKFKWCRVCGRKRETELFSADSSSWDKLQPKCNPCAVKLNREYRAANPEKVKEQAKERQRKYREKKRLSKMKCLYVDDERQPKTDRDWVIVRSYAEAVEYVTKNGCPNYISFDHDLGSELNGYDLAKWLVAQDIDGTTKIPMGFEFNVHSANSVGAENIQKLLDRYLEFKKEEQ